MSLQFRSGYLFDDGISEGVLLNSQPLRAVRKNERPAPWNHSTNKIDEFTSRKVDEKYQLATTKPVNMGRPLVTNRMPVNYDKDSSLSTTLNNLDKTFSKSIRRGIL